MEEEEEEEAPEKVENVEEVVEDVKNHTKNNITYFDGNIISLQYFIITVFHYYSISL